jgi:hypothetical protein
MKVLGQECPTHTCNSNININTKINLKVKGVGAEAPLFHDAAGSRHD